MKTQYVELASQIDPELFSVIIIENLQSYMQSGWTGGTLQANEEDG